MATFLTTVGKHTALLGLDWRQPAVREGVTDKQAVREQAERLGARYGVVFETADGRIFVGLLPPNAQARATRAYAGAVWFADAVSEPTLFVRNLGGGNYWVVFARPGELDPTTDKILEEAKAVDLVDKVLSELQDEDVKARVYFDGGPVPNAAMFQTAAPEPLELAMLLVRAEPRAPMRPKQLLGIKPVTWVALAALAALVGAAIALKLWLDHLAEQRELERMQAALMAQSANTGAIDTLTDAKIAQAVLRELDLDTRTESPRLAIARCTELYSKLGAGRAGWRVATIECQREPAQAQVNFELGAFGTRAVGTNFALDRYAQDAFRLKPSFNADGMRAQLSLPLTVTTLREPVKPAELPPMRDVMLTLGTRLQLAKLADEGFGAQVQAAQPRAVLFEDPAKANEEGAMRFSPAPDGKTYRAGQIQVTGRSLATLFGLSLELPYLRIDKIFLRPSFNGLEWTVEATYVVATS